MIPLNNPNAPIQHNTIKNDFILCFFSYCKYNHFLLNKKIILLNFIKIYFGKPITTRCHIILTPGKKFSKKFYVAIRTGSHRHDCEGYKIFINPKKPQETQGFLCDPRSPLGKMKFIYWYPWVTQT